MVIGNQEVIRKQYQPSSEEAQGIQALKIWQGLGAVPILYEEPNGIYMPHCGLDLRHVDESLAQSVFVDTFQRLHARPLHCPEFRNVFDLGKVFERCKAFASLPFSKDLLSKAKSIFLDLCQTSQNQTVLHGDLHHENILWNGQDKSVVIDPKGLIGEIEYEVGAFLRNPNNRIEYANSTHLLSSRMTQICEALSIDFERVALWSWCQAVMSTLWCVEDQIQIDGALLHFQAINEIVLTHKL